MFLSAQTSLDGFQRRLGWISSALIACSSATEPQLPAPDGSQLISGATFSCLIDPRSQSDSRCWGRLGSAPQPPTAPVVVEWPETLGVFSILSASDHICGLTVDGVAYCWGPNDFGQLGNGTTNASPVPTAVATNIRFQTISAGIRSTCAIDLEGTAYCWGLDDLGRLGRGVEGSGVAQVTPVSVSGSRRFSTIEGAWIYCALGAPDYHAYCWGALSGTFDPENAPEPGDCEDYYFIEFVGVDCLRPTLLTGGLTFVEMSIGGNTACGLTPGGSAHCWGEGALGQLGNGVSGPGARAVQPAAVTGGLTFQTIAAGATHVCGLIAEGKAYCWGNNFRGYLGVPQTSVPLSAEPLEVAGGHSFEALAAGWYHTCGRTPEGEVWCWGSGLNGALGRDPEVGDSYVPVQVPLN